MRMFTSSGKQSRPFVPRPLLRWGMLALVCLVSIAGCSNISDRIPKRLSLGEFQTKDARPIGERAESASQAARVSNPPAQQIRFDGQEQLLGGGNCESLPTQKLLAQLVQLEEAKKFRSAKTLVRLHKRSARRLLLESTSRSGEAVMNLVATTLDEGTASKPWGKLLADCQRKPREAKQWQSLLINIGASPKDSDATTQAIEELAQVGSQFDNSLLRIEAMRLSGELQVATEQTTAAIETFVSAAELAAKEGPPSLASDLWLMSCEASLRADEVQQARQCWKAAVSSQLTSIHARSPQQSLPTIDSVFWEQAVRLAHPSDELPKELTVALAPWHSRLGTKVDESLSPSVALWSAIAEYQLATGQPHLAALSIKKAETNAPASSRPYLQIALARAMAAQGQHSVATTILGTEAESSNPNIRASALAVLGAIKIQSGAYEQGGRFLSQALSIREASNWPGKLAAKADLANVRLILGNLDDALTALHTVQYEMLAEKKWQSLCHSLENEASILELEGQTIAARDIRTRIDEIERDQ